MAGLGVRFLSSRIVRRTKYIFLLAVVALLLFMTNLYYIQKSAYPPAFKSGSVLRESMHSTLHVASQRNIIASPNGVITADNVYTPRPSPTAKPWTCDDRRVTLSRHGILLFKNLTIRSRLAYAKAAGVQLERPNEADEFYTLRKGFFTLYCNHGWNIANKLLRRAESSGVLGPWVRAVEIVNTSRSPLFVEQAYRRGFYLAIQRLEYANVYWTVIDLLDIFITTQYFDIDPEKLTIIIMDAHYSTSLDPFWDVVFYKKVKPIDGFFTDSKDVLLENLIWRYPRVNCPFLDRKLESFRYIQPFRSFVLKRFGISAEARLRNCSHQRFHVLVSFRRDYKTHPRNLDAIVDRKISNEADVLKEMSTAFPSFNITGVQLDALPLRRQLQLIASSDIFFGMHGAAHGFTIFMPPGGAVVELFDFGADNWHMKHVATLSGHSHISWTNSDTKAYDAKTRSTKIPSGVPTRLIKEAIQKLCR